MYKKYNKGGKIYKRNFKKKKSYQKPMRYKVADMAYQAFRGVNYLKGLVNAELHSADFTASAQNITNTGSVIPLTTIAQGDNYNNRQGNSILAKYLFGRMEFAKNSSATSTFIRLMFIQDTQQIGDTDPGIADILSSSSTISSLNQFQKGRFSVLRDTTIRLEPNQTTDVMKVNLKLPFHIKFNGTSGSDIQKNGVYLVVLSNESTNYPVFSYNLRISFYDN